jgi:hypothetical protein
VTLNPNRDSLILLSRHRNTVRTLTHAGVFQGEEESDAMIEAPLTGIRDLTTPECEVFVAHFGGSMARVPADATAYPQRQPHFMINVHTRWREWAEDAACIAWGRELIDATASGAAGTYLNFMPDDEVDRVGAAYSPNMARLAEIKHRYDPTKLFRTNHNIAPASSAQAVA